MRPGTPRSGSTTMSPCTVSLWSTLSKPTSLRSAGQLRCPDPRAGVQLRPDDPRRHSLDGWTDRHRRDGRDAGGDRSMMLRGSVQTPLPSLLPSAHVQRLIVVIGVRLLQQPTSTHCDRRTGLCCSVCPPLSIMATYQTREQPMTDSTKNLLEITAALTASGVTPKIKVLKTHPRKGELVMTMTKGRRTKTNRRGDALRLPPTSSDPYATDHPTTNRHDHPLRFRSRLLRRHLPAH